MKGIWYSLATDDDEYFNAYKICDPDFEAKLSISDIPYWISNEEVIYDLRPLRIRDYYHAEFVEILSFLINRSPIRAVMFLVSFQGADHEIVCGVFSKVEFLDLLNKGRILCNICYIIRE